MVIRLLTLLALLAPACLIGRRSLHMYQLCSYQDQSYRIYLSQNQKETFGVNRLLPLALQLLGTLWWRPLTLIGAALFVLVNPIKKAKKPLVFTNRVKRLSFTMAVLPVLAGLFLPPLAPLLALLLPYGIMLAARVNKPVEDRISKGYMDDARRILSENPGLTIIGITGSYGKTSTKYFLKELLSVKYNVYMTPGNFNTPLGVTRAVREGLKPTHEIFLCEMGARHVGDVQELCDFVHPHMGVVTSVGPQHLETFGSQDNITNEKLALYRATKDRGGAFVNLDSPILAQQNYDGKVTRYGTSEGCDYRGGDIRVTAVGSEFTVTSPDGETAAFKTRLLGPANVQNLIGAIAVANRMGVSMKALVPAIRALESVPHRLQLLSGGPGVMYIDDAYNANPQGARAALDTLALCEGMARVLLTPGMVELGEQEQELNRQMGEYAATRCDFAILVDPKRGPAIRQGLLDGGFPAERIFSTDSLQKGLDHAATLGTRMVLLLNDLTDQY